MSDQQHARPIVFEQTLSAKELQEWRSKLQNPETWEALKRLAERMLAKLAAEKTAMSEHEKPREWTLSNNAAGWSGPALDAEHVKVVEAEPVERELKALTTQRDSWHREYEGALRKLKLERKELLDALGEALEYVPDYFIEKHDMRVLLRKYGRLGGTQA